MTPKPTAKELKVGAVIFVLLSLALFALSLGSEHLWRTQDMSTARAALRAHGYDALDIHGHSLASCARGSNGYEWRAAHAEGRLCVGMRESVIVFVDRNF